MQTIDVILMHIFVDGTDTNDNPAVFFKCIYTLNESQQEISQDPWLSVTGPSRKLVSFEIIDFCQVQNHDAQN